MTKLGEENTRRLHKLIDDALNKRAEPQHVDFLVKSHPSGTGIADFFFHGC